MNGIMILNTENKLREISVVNYDYIKNNVYYNRFYIILSVKVNTLFEFNNFVKIDRGLFTTAFTNFIMNLIILTILCRCSIIVINN